MLSNVLPFKAIHYNTNQVGRLADVIIPPYDVISPADADKYRTRSPYNFSHVVLPKNADDSYDGAKSTLENWLGNGLLQEDKSPFFYLYRQDFTWEGKTYSRSTLMAQVELKDFSEKIIRPHENTHGKHKADRLKILTKTQTNLSHVFAMVKDPEGFLNLSFETWGYKAPLFSCTFDDGVSHCVWRIPTEASAKLTHFFSDKPLYIVDGHHRYESALNYARQTGALGNASHPANYMLFAIANCFDPGLLVLPTHRWVAASQLPRAIEKSLLESVFTLEKATADRILDFVKTIQDEPKFGLKAWGEYYFCTPKDWQAAKNKLGAGVAQLSVTWSDEFVLRDLAGIAPDERSQKITYEKNAPLIVDRAMPSDIAIFHAAPPIEAITRVADEGGFMPQKSTYFYPKLFAGLTLRRAAP